MRRAYSEVKGAHAYSTSVHGDLLLASRWNIESVAGPGLSVGTNPGIITVPPNGHAAFQITVDASAAPSGVQFGAITLRRLFLGRFPIGESLHLAITAAKP